MLEEMASLVKNDMQQPSSSDEEEKKNGDLDDSDSDDGFGEDRDTNWAGASQRKKSKSPMRGAYRPATAQETKPEPLAGAVQPEFDHTLQTIPEA